MTGTFGPDPSGSVIEMRSMTAPWAPTSEGALVKQVKSRTLAETDVSANRICHHQGDVVKQVIRGDEVAR